MTDEKFWKIADKYEKTNLLGQTYIPLSNRKDLVKEVVEANDYNLFESLDDLQLLFQGRLPKCCVRYCTELCKEKKGGT